MYYESSVVQNVLKCTFCSAKFADVVKLIPNCGNSICGDCYRELRDELSEEESKFKCRACHQNHEMPKSGLADNRALMTMLQFKPEEKALPENAKSLRRLLDQVQEKLEAVEAIDEDETINSHCDMLVNQVIEAVESDVKHLNKIGNDLLSEIGDYRKQLLGSKTTRTNGKIRDASRVPQSEAEKEFNTFRRQIDAFSQKWMEYFSEMDRVATDEEIEVAQRRAHGFLSHLSTKDIQLKNEIFKNRVLRFRSNFLYSQTGGHLGFLEYDSSVCADSGAHGSDLIVCDRNDGRLVDALKSRLTDPDSLICLASEWLASRSIDSSIRIWSLNERKPTFLVYGEFALDQVIYAVNCGGDEFIDSYGIRYSKDTHGKYGIASDYGLKFDIKRVSAHDRHLYQLERYWNRTFGYSICLPTDDADYVLWLKFSEVWFNGPRKKVFDVTLNGEVIVRQLDIFERVGQGVAHDEAVGFQVRHGGLLINGNSRPFLNNNEIRVEFVKGPFENPKINAIIVLKGTIDQIPKLAPLYSR